MGVGVEARGGGEGGVMQGEKHGEGGWVGGGGRRSNI